MRQLEHIIVSFSNLIVDFPEIREMDVNPIAIRNGRACALDARIILDPETIASRRVPCALFASRHNPVSRSTHHAVASTGRHGGSVAPDPARGRAFAARDAYHIIRGIFAGEVFSDDPDH